MDKVTKEELMKKLNLTEEELDKIVGGSASHLCDELEGLDEKSLHEYCRNHTYECTICGVRA